jgi:hypothetical protein
VNVPLDFVHRLAHSDGGSKVDDGVDTGESRFGTRPVSDAAVDERYALGKRRRRPAVHLGLEAVEHDHFVALLGKASDEV